MKGLDTNVLVRYLVGDDANQAATAARHIERHCRADAPCFINAVVLCELVWVLESAYDQPKAVIAEVIEKLLRTAQFAVEDAEMAWAALSDYRAHGADFADCLIGRRNRAQGCEDTATFDKALKGLATFRLI